MRRLTFTAVAVFFAVLPATAGATTGAIDGLSVAPDLSTASVTNLDVSYDECTVEVPDCTWTATAMLAPPQWGYCPPAWSVFLEALGNPTGLPDPPPGSYRERHAWGTGFSGNGVRQSGPITIGLEGVNDYRLCLYATHFSAPPPYPPVEPPNLLAEHLLHVDQPPASISPTPPVAVPPKRCKKRHRHKRAHAGRRCQTARHRHPQIRQVHSE